MSAKTFSQERWKHGRPDSGRWTDGHGYQRTRAKWKRIGKRARRRAMKRGPLA